MQSSSTSLVLFALLAVAASAHASGCSVDCHDNLTCGEPPAGGSGGGGGSGPPGCVPSESDAPVDDTCGIFVAANGNDMAAGSKSAPLATFKKAIEMAGSTKRIYACAEEFDEAVEIPPGFTVFGGLGCALSWEYIGAQVKTSIKGAPGELPLKLLGGGGVTRLFDIRAEAAPADMPGAPQSRPSPIKPTWSSSGASSSRATRRPARTASPTRRRPRTGQSGTRAETLAPASR